MVSIDPFPESNAKDYIRSEIRGVIKKFALTKKLNYLGLPSARMLDVVKWADYLSNIIAIEMDPKIAELIFMTATRNHIRGNLLVFEKPLKDVIRMLLKSDYEISDDKNLFNIEKNNYLIAKKIDISLINYDFCAGLLYVSGKKEPENIEIFKDTIKYQKGKEFLWTITLNLRDTGFEEYKLFIEDTIKKLDTSETNRDKLWQYFVKQKNNAFTKQVENLRFCLPIYLNKESKDNFDCECLGQWKYCSGKTHLYQLIMHFTPNCASALGSVFPDFNDIKKLIEIPLKKIRDNGTGIEKEHQILLE